MASGEAPAARDPNCRSAAVVRRVPGAVAHSCVNDTPRAAGVVGGPRPRISGRYLVGTMTASTLAAVLVSAIRRRVRRVGAGTAAVLAPSSCWGCVASVGDACSARRTALATHRVIRWADAGERLVTKRKSGHPRTTVGTRRSIGHMQQRQRRQTTPRGREGRAEPPRTARPSSLPATRPQPTLAKDAQSRAVSGCRRTTRESQRFADQRGEVRRCRGVTI